MKLPMSTVVSRDSCMFCSYALMTMTNFHSTVDQNPLIKTPCYFTFLTAFIGTDLVSSGQHSGHRHKSCHFTLLALLISGVHVASWVLKF